MKNEDKIVELLTDSSKRQDRYEELLKLQGKSLDKLIEGQERLIQGFHKMNDLPANPTGKNGRQDQQA